MPISFSADEREALCEVVKAQRDTLKDVWSPLAEQEWDEAERVFRHYLQDCHLLELLHLGAPDENGQIDVDMQTGELRETLTRVITKRTARLVVEESAGVPTPEQELFQQRASVALRACERSLRMLSSRFEVRYVVVDTETGGPAAQPTLHRDFAIEVCDVLNETKSSTSDSPRRCAR